MAARNYYVYSDDTSVLKSLKEDYESMGRECKIEGNRLVVLARTPLKKPVDKKTKSKVESNKEQRPKRRE